MPTSILTADGDRIRTFDSDPVVIADPSGQACAYFDCGTDVGGTSDCNVPLLDVTCPSIPTTVAGTFLSGTVGVSAGTAPYAFTISQGALPPGVSLDGATGIISGTPTLDGVYSYTVQVTDANDVSSSADCAITVIAFGALQPVIGVAPRDG